MNIDIPEKGLSIRANVEVRMYDEKYIKTYKDYLIAKNRGLLDKVTIQKDTGENLVVNAGLNQIILLLNNGSAVNFTFCGVGSSNTAVLATDTDLNTSIVRIAVTNIYQSANVGHWDTFFNSTTGNGTIWESGLFSLVSAGIMLCHKLLGSSFAKTTNNTMTISWTLQVSAV